MKTFQRILCPQCLRSPINCYCREIEKFDPGFPVVILTHPREAQKHIATGRLAHRCLKGSIFLTDYDFSSNQELRALLENQSFHPLVLFPGNESLNLSRLSSHEKSSVIPPQKTPLLIAIDGTWSTARKTMRRCSTLEKLPQISFDSVTPSRIRIREQPEPSCLSTIEAIHRGIELMAPACGLSLEKRPHDALLRSLDRMIDRQILLARAHHALLWSSTL